MIRLLFANANMRLEAAQGRKMRGINLERTEAQSFTEERLRKSGMRAEAEDKESADEEEEGRGGEGRLNVEGTPEEADEEAG